MSKQEKQPDWDILEFAAQATKLIEKNFKILLGLFIAAVIGGSAWALLQSQQRSHEMAAFTELYKITKIYNKKKAEFEEAEEQAKPKDPKKDVAESPEQKKDLTPATGDLQKDYPQVVAQLEAYLDKNPGRNASGEAALLLSEIYDNYKMPEKGSAALDKVLKNWNQKNVLYYVMQMRAGDLYASASNCEKAVSFWTVVANSKSFVAKQAQLKLGVCLQEIGRMEEAKQWFTQLQADDPNSSEGFSAKRYLRFLKFKNKVDGDKTADDKAHTEANKEDQAS